MGVAVVVIVVAVIIIVAAAIVMAMVVIICHVFVGFVTQIHLPILIVAIVVDASVVELANGHFELPVLLSALVVAKTCVIRLSGWSIYLLQARQRQTWVLDRRWQGIVGTRAWV